MSEIRATDLVRPSIAAEGPDSFEIRSANLVKVIPALSEDDS